MVLKIIISGGQIGADRGALEAAKDLGITTRGFAPKNYQTRLGNDISLRDEFGLCAIPGGYKERTRLNVEEADGTIRFAFDFSSPGERCTLNSIRYYNRPYLDIDLSNPNLFTLEHIKATTLWIIQNNIQVLNVAGNTGESVVNNKVHQLVYKYMCLLISNCKAYPLWTL
jgi:hypothetical protein